MNLIDAQALAATSAQQDADFGRLCAALIFITLAFAIAWAKGEERTK